MCMLNEKKNLQDTEMYIVFEHDPVKHLCRSGQILEENVQNQYIVEVRKEHFSFECIFLFFSCLP